MANRWFAKAMAADGTLIATATKAAVRPSAGEIVQFCGKDDNGVLHPKGTKHLQKSVWRCEEKSDFTPPDDEVLR